MKTPKNDKSRSFCPFRVQTPDHQAGCTLQLGVTVKCYTQQNQPLIRRGDCFICPIVGIHLDLELFSHLKIFLEPILRIQDEYEISINIWPMLKGIAESPSPSETLVGIHMVKLAISISEALNEIILELM